MIGIFPTYGVIFNSNTTLVKVKLDYAYQNGYKVANSNTTLVKVKFSITNSSNLPINLFKYNTC